jgi:hypothetical protein
MYFIILNVSNSVLRFIALVGVKVLCEHFIGQYDILIHSSECTVKKQKESTKCFPRIIGSKILNKMDTKKKGKKRKKDERERKMKK